MRREFAKQEPPEIRRRQWEVPIPTRPLLALILAGCAEPALDHPQMADDLVVAYTGIPSAQTVRVLIVPESGVDVNPRLAAVGGHGRRFARVPVVVAELTRAQATALASEPGVWLAADRPLQATGKTTGITIATEADLVRRAIGADQVQAGVTGAVRDGAGVVIGIVDSGISEKEKDFPKGLVVASADFAHGGNKAATIDAYGHGTLVAGVISGTRTGAQGVAPGARLISARAIDEHGAGTTADAIEAIDWLVDNAEQTGLRILHLSIGAAPHESFTHDPLALAVESALDAGIVVVAAAGNYGRSDGAEVYGGILSPGTHPGVITVGATDPHGTARRSDDHVAPFSSRGPTLFDGLGKPDLVAPGVALPLLSRSSSELWTLHPGSRVGTWPGVDLKNGDYALASGTSFAAPAVSGTIALMLQANPDLSPMAIKAALELTATSLPDPTGLAAGAGELNALGAVRLAEMLANPAHPVLVTSDRLSGEDVPWGLTLYWDGFASGDDDLSAWNADGVLGVGGVAGTGILWDGTVPKFVGLKINGPALALADQTLWTTQGTWGSGILWDGTLSMRSGRTWTSDPVWTSALVWPENIDDAVSGAIEPAEPSGLTAPVSGAPDPTPLMPDFGSP